MMSEEKGCIKCGTEMVDGKDTEGNVIALVCPKCFNCVSTQTSDKKVDKKGK